MQIYCKTAKALILLGCESDIGPMRFPNDDSRYPGIVLDVDLRLPIVEQIQQRMSELLGDPAYRRHILVEPQFSAEVEMADGTTATLYLATVAARHHAAKLEWPTMPEILRGMPKDRNRLPYLRAWQILSGGLQENVKAVDLAEVLKHLDEE